MAVGGLYVATAGRDQTIRLFNRTQEVIVNWNTSALTRWHAIPHNTF